MVQRKSHKNKPKNQRNNKVIDGTKLNAQLGVIGLKIVHVTADGNCLFRAVADQLEGNEEEHLKYREMVVDYIEAHRDEYEPFLEDEVPFDEYCRSMKEVGTWAGHMELQAVSLVTRTNICIHKLLSPRWHIQNFKSTETCCIHLSYHNEEHYNSVRRKDDFGGGPAKRILFEKSPIAYTNMGREAGQVQSSAVLETSSKHLLCSPEENNRLHNLLDVGAEDGDHEGENLTESVSNGKEKNGVTEPIDKFISDRGTPLGIAEENVADKNASQQGQKVARNKVCPCGSKKKYKACCGAVTRSSRVTTNSRAMSNKERKEKMRSSKGATVPTLNETPISTLDMGYLCI